MWFFQDSPTGVSYLSSSVNFPKPKSCTSDGWVYFISKRDFKLNGTFSWIKGSLNASIGSQAHKWSQLLHASSVHIYYSCSSMEVGLLNEVNPCIKCAYTPFNDNLIMDCWDRNRMGIWSALAPSETHEAMRDEDMLVIEIQWQTSH